MNEKLCVKFYYKLIYLLVNYFRLDEDIEVKFCRSVEDNLALHHINFKPNRTIGSIVMANSKIHYAEVWVFSKNGYAVSTD